MRITLDNNAIQSISMFEKITGATVIDSIQDEDTFYFVVANGHYGLAVGKGGIKIKNAEKIFRKSIKVFEYNDDVKIFIKNLAHDAQDVIINDKTATIKIKPSDRPKIIGKGGKNIKIITQLLERAFEIKEIKLK